MKKISFKYLLLCMIVYLSLTLIEIFALKPLLDFIDDSFVYDVLIYNVLLLIANPFLTKFVVDCWGYKLVKEDGE